MLTRVRCLSLKPDMDREVLTTQPSRLQNKHQGAVMRIGLLCICDSRASFLSVENLEMKYDVLARVDIHLFFFLLSFELY